MVEFVYKVKQYITKNGGDKKNDDYIQTCDVDMI